MKISKKKQEKLTKEKEERLYMNLFFYYLWHSTPSPKRCRQCGAYLPTEVNTACLDHLLEKSIHPEIKFLEENIYLCCIDCHTKKTGGKPGADHKLALEEFRNKYFENKEYYVRKNQEFKEEVLASLVQKFKEIQAENESDL